MSSAIDSGILYGRPYGGVMTLINKSLRPYTQSIYTSDRCTIITLFHYVIMNVYFPCTGTTDRLEILDNLLCEIGNHFDDCTDCVYLLGGDFNCDVDHNDPAARMVKNFLKDKSLSRCDECLGVKAKYTYSNESLNTRSCIDYFCVSDNKCTVEFNVIDEGSNLSDHLPINVVCSCDFAMPTNSSSPSSCNNSTQEFLRWDHADLLAYYTLTGTHLQALLPEVNSLVDDAGVDNDRNETIHVVNSIYDKIVDILRNCANITVPLRKNLSTSSGGARNLIASSNSQSTITNCGNRWENPAVGRFLINVEPASCCTSNAFVNSSDTNPAHIRMNFMKRYWLRMDQTSGVVGDPNLILKSPTPAKLTV
jgi:hypothetical protein